MELWRAARYAPFDKGVLQARIWYFPRFVLKLEIILFFNLGLCYAAFHFANSICIGAVFSPHFLIGANTAPWVLCLERQHMVLSALHRAARQRMLVLD
ncbi:MAG: hypothetical protein AAF700_09945 [Pseudomonadota bacterium]